MDVYLNGEMVAPDAARVSADDAGFQHAVGLFETMRASHGRVFRLERHLARIAQSAESLGLRADRGVMEQAVKRSLEHNELDEARLRMTLTPGRLSLLGSEADAAPDPTLLVVPSPPTEYDPAYFEDGIRVRLGPPGANPFDPLAGHKSLAYWGRLRSLRQAAAAGAGETIWLNVSNHLASGAVSNLLIVRDGTLLTPYARGEEEEGALPAPVRPGVTREAVLELAEELAIPVERRMLTVADLLGAEEAMLTNASWRVLPVSRVENETIGSGSAGPMTRRLREALLKRVDAETAGDGRGE